MTTLTEGLHPGEAIKSEAKGTRSRDAITVESGQTLVANTVIADNAGVYGAYTGTAPYDTAAGVLLEAVDASGAAAPGVGIMRDAEINDASLFWHADVDGTEKTDGIADLAAVGVIVRLEA